ncbi:hypothetical protein [Iningainema tapete]|nr:hypothetical protein [Iningainema tapete]
MSKNSSRENSSTPVEPTLTEISLVIRLRKIRHMILDYALGNAILGLIPIPRLFTLKLLVAAIFIIKMIRNIGAKWDFPKAKDALAIAGNIFGWIGAFAIALMAWLTMITIGVFIPYVGGFALAAALFTLTWVLGQVTNQFYFQSLIGIYTKQLPPS